MSIAVFVVALGVGILAFIGILQVAVLRWVHRKQAVTSARLETEFATTGERLQRGPEPGLYRGGSDGYPRVRGNATIVLSDRRLIIVMAVGARVEVPRYRIASVRTSRAFRGGIQGRKLHVVVSTTDGAEVGFIAADPDAWVAALPL